MISSYDRQSAFGDQDRVEKLFQWLDSGANKRAREIASRMLSEYKISTSEAWPVILHQDSQGAIVGNTNGSAGYMHVAAYRYEDLPEGLKSRGLEMVLSHNYKHIGKDGKLVCGAERVQDEREHKDGPQALCPSCEYVSPSPIAPPSRRGSPYFLKPSHSQSQSWCLIRTRSLTWD